MMQLTNTYSYFISSNQDKLNKILQKYRNDFCIDCDYINQLLIQYPVLNHLDSGQVLSWIVAMRKEIKCLVWSISPREVRIYSNNVGNFFKEGIVKVLKKSSSELFYEVLFIGKLTGTFINSVRDLGLEENCIVDIINAFQYQLDFRKLHQGDRFSILVSLGFNDNNIQSKLIGVRLNTSGRDYYAFRAKNGKFYNQDAIKLGSNLMRFPILKPYRISSNFNLSRLNPVTGQISPHSGVDFAIPVGSPVFAVGDGEVLISKYSKIAGNYIVIKHNHQCTTRYMHLSKLFVKIGQKVKRGDNIALSGNTGRSTGPHLHFEVWMNHHPVNPLNANIVSIEKLLGNERFKYLNQIHEIIPQLSFD